MKKINILSSDIYNKIAAGEVVERPASVVKELVENSIDAGATEIFIEIEQGGCRKISVFDNGGGIASDDIENAFLPHSTSKIKSADDLGDIKTLGFRGEALASIASVSRVRIVSRSAEDEVGTELRLEGGKICEKNAVSANVGTRIEIEDLFFNTPARKKFLKTPSREAGEISNFVSRLLLANPKIKIKYSIDGKGIYDFHGGGTEEAIFTVYGKECLDNCLAVESFAKNVKISGYIGAPSYNKPNTTSQTVIINGRYVNCAVVAAAAKNAYVPYLMTRQYPFYVLYIELPFDEIDVNVHPSKLEVKFLNGQDVFMATFLAAKDVLANASKQYKQKIEIKTEPFGEKEQYANVSMFPPNNAQGKEFAYELIKARLRGGEQSENGANSAAADNFDSQSEGAKDGKNISGGVGDNNDRILRGGESGANGAEHNGEKNDVNDGEISAKNKFGGIYDYNGAKLSSDFQNQNGGNSDKNAFLCKNEKSSLDKNFDNNGRGFGGNNDIYNANASEKAAATVKKTYGILNENGVDKKIGEFDFGASEKSVGNNFDNQNNFHGGDAELNLNGEFDGRAGVAQPYMIADATKNTQGIFSDAKFLGVVFDTYIMLERGDFLFIVDQHAAHERILYDIYMKQYAESNIVTQPLLVPYVFEVTDGENAYIQQNLGNLGNGGFEIEEFGHNAYKLSAIPHAFVGMSVEKFVKEVLTSIRYFDMSTSALTSEALARRACKAAIKAGDKLDIADVFALLRELDNMENLKCPHGRPIVVVYSIVEFEKWFKRIV